MEKDTLNLAAAAEFLGVSERKMWQMAKAGEIETLQNPLDRREKHFRRKDLEKLKRPKNGNKTHAREEVYNYPPTTCDPGGSGLTDAPTYSSMTESWTRDGVNIDQAVTNYSSQPNANPRTVIITLPNGIKSIQNSHYAPGNFLDVLVFQDQTLDSANTVLQSSSVTWAQGAYESPRPTRVEATNELLQMTATEFSYGSVYNQVTEVRNYDYGGTTLLRATHTQHQNTANYTNRHILNSPLVVEVFPGDNTTRVSRVEYRYDSQTVTNTPGVVMHSQTHDPYAPTETICDWWPNPHNPDQDIFECRSFNPYNPATDYRGNVTQVTAYADAVNLTGPVTETRRMPIHFRRRAARQPIHMPK